MAKTKTIIVAYFNGNQNIKCLLLIAVTCPKAKATNIVARINAPNHVAVFDYLMAIP